MMGRVENVRDRSRATSREVRRFLENCIANGTLGIGDKIPNERDLADQFSTGRSTIRRLFVALEAEGMVERHVGRGTFIKNIPVAARSTVAGRPHEQSPALTQSDKTVTEHIRRAGPLDLMELRLAIEPHAAQYSALRAGSDEIGRMQDSIDRSRVAKSLSEFEGCDDDLHREIASASRNPLFVAIAAVITSVRTAGEWGTLKERSLTEDRKAMHLEEHVAILAAIRRRDPVGARREMEKHLKNVLEGMVEHAAPIAP